MRRLFTLALAGAITLALVLADPTGAYKTYPTLDATASWLAQRPVEYRCLSQWESDHDYVISVWGAAAYVEFAEGGGPEDYAVAAQPWCKVLRALRVGRASAWSAEYVVASVLILVHESGHLRGSSFPYWSNEAIVNCWAVRRAAAVAVLRFRIPESAMPAFNNILADIYRNQPPEYQWPGCLKGIPGVAP